MAPSLPGSDHFGNGLRRHFGGGVAGGTRKFANAKIFLHVVYIPKLFRNHSLDAPFPSLSTRLSNWGHYIYSLEVQTKQTHPGHGYSTKEQQRVAGNMHLHPTTTISSVGGVAESQHLCCISFSRERGSKGWCVCGIIAVSINGSSKRHIFSPNAPVVQLHGVL